MATDDVTIRVRNPDSDAWETIGVDRLAGIHPEHVVLTADDTNGVAGSGRATFDLRRDPIFTYPDLTAYNSIEIEIAGSVVWRGRILETPARDGAEDVITVQCEGSKYHLDDDAYVKVYVHTRLGDYKDIRSVLAQSLGATSAYAAGQVSADGAVTLAMPKDVALASTSFVAVVLDLGPSSTAKHIVVEWEASNNTSQVDFIARTSSVPETSATFDNAFTFALNVGASGTSAASFATARRYVQLILAANAAFTPGADVFVKLKAVKVFSATAYESGTVSILKADTVIKDALVAAPELDQSTAGIAAGDFSFPDFAQPWNPQTPREWMVAANALHNNLIKVEVDDTLTFAARPTTPLYEVGSWSDAEFEDASLNNAQDVYSKVHVTGTGPDANPVLVTRTQTGTILDKNSLTRTRTLPISAAVTTPVAERIGDTFLDAHSASSLRGSLIVYPGSLRSRDQGIGVHPSRLLRDTGQLLHFGHRIDPDTGGLGRAGRIATVTYTHDTREARVELDNTRRNFEAQLARYSLLTGR